MGSSQSSKGINEWLCPAATAVISSLLLNWPVCGLFDVGLLIAVHAVSFCLWGNCRCILHICNSAANLEQEQTHTEKERETCTCTQAHKHAQTFNTHAHILACTNIHMHMCTVGMHTTHIHTCKTYIDALVIVVCCCVLVNIEMAMGMM